ncbi:MAG: hypothetical protein GQ549_07630 [Gammaproteobacteria bacterium]|nr:hypothetical protein [Gammaproteobacteria bacterium]
MTTKHGLNRLSRALQELYYKLCDMDLHKHMDLYNRNTGTNETSDISTSLTKQIDKLAPASQPGKPNSASASATTVRSSKRASKPDNVKQASQPSGWLNKMVSNVSRPKKTFTGKITADPYMGNKLKDSTWSHIHTALLHARQGDASTAKLHADIACEALKEAAHYMSKEDHKILCAEVAKALLIMAPHTNND